MSRSYDVCCPPGARPCRSSHSLACLAADRNDDMIAKLEPGRCWQIQNIGTRRHTAGCADLFEAVILEFDGAGLRRAESRTQREYGY